MKKYCTALAAAAVLVSTPVMAETLDNSSIVQLVEVGLGESAIIAKIESTAATFDVTTADLIDLKAAGVPSNVIAAMIGKTNGAAVSNSATASLDSPDPMVPHPSGIYILEDWLDTPKMEMIDATTSNQTKTGGFLGYALTGGLASLSFKAAIPNREARVKSPKDQPTFYFYFDQANASLSDRGNFWGANAVTSPAEFSLVRFKVKKNRREAKVGSFNIGGAKTGVMEKDQIPFDYDRLAPGVFEVRPLQSLEEGEYGFIYSSSTGGSAIGMAGAGSTTSRIFDFSIKDAAAE